MRFSLLPLAVVALLAGSVSAADSAPPTYTLTAGRAAQLKAVTIVSRTLHIRSNDSDAEVQAIKQIKDALTAAHVMPTGGPIFIFHTLPTDPSTEIDIEVGMPVDDGVKAPEGCQARVLAATPTVTALYQGPTDSVGTAIGELFQQLFAMHLTPSGELRTRSLYYEELQSPNNVMILEIPTALP